MQEVGQMSEGMGVLGLSYASLYRYVFRRSQKSGLHLGHLTCHMVGFEKRADSLQHKCLRRLLRLRGPVPRCILLSEHDIGRRLSVDLLADAIMLWNRIMTYPKYNRVLQACELAAKHKGTWTAHVVKMMKNCGVITVQPEVPRGGQQTPQRAEAYAAKISERACAASADGAG